MTMVYKNLKIALCTTAISVALSGYAVKGAMLAQAEEPPPPASQQTPPQARQGKLIQTREIDVTGDGKLDLVSLVGMKSDPDSPYYNRLFISVVGEGQAQVVIPLEGGYNPRWIFVTLSTTCCRRSMYPLRQGEAAGTPRITFIHSKITCLQRFRCPNRCMSKPPSRITIR